jgi:hypothetical protein
MLPKILKLRNKAVKVTKRMIDSKIRSSQTFAKLDYRQRDLWQGLIEVADDQGRMPGSAAFVRSQVWAYDEVSVNEVEADLNTLQKLTFAFRYEVNECLYLQIINWHYYQSASEWLAPSKYPAPSGWIDHARYHGKDKDGKKQIITLNWDSRPSEPVLHYIYDASLPTPLPSGLPTPLPSHEVKVNDDVNGNGDGDVKPTQTTAQPEKQTNYSKFMQAFCEKTHIPETHFNPQKCADAIKQMADAGVTVDDMTNAIDELMEKKYSVVGPWSVVNASCIQMSRRLNPVRDKTTQLRPDNKPTPDQIAKARERLLQQRKGQVPT